MKRDSTVYSFVLLDIRHFRFSLRSRHALREPSLSFLEQIRIEHQEIENANAYNNNNTSFLVEMVDKSIYSDIARVIADRC